MTYVSSILHKVQMFWSSCLNERTKLKLCCCLGVEVHAVPSQSGEGNADESPNALADGDGDVMRCD